MIRHRTPQMAFSLVELSIVLVILGLLVGGVLSGQALIRASQLRSVITEKDKYIGAYYAFKDKYMALPGDMGNAFSYWGATCGTDTTTLSTGCNGDNNGQISVESEGLLAWEHLARAGLIEGSYDGSGTVVSGFVRLSSTNLPASKFPQGYWNMSYMPAEAITFTASQPTRTTLALGGLDASYIDYGWVGSLAALKLEEAYNIDMKTDDGHSNTGKVSGGHDGSCEDNGTDYYSLILWGAGTVNQCIMFFIVE